MDQRRVLIVESQNEFALSLAAVLRNQGYATALAQNAAEAQREVEKRRPDLLVLRAELPDMSGFSLCGQLKKQREPLSIVLMSSDAADAFAQHQQGPTPADGYLAIPFQMEELSSVVDKLLVPMVNPEGDDLDQAMDQSLGLAPKPEAPQPEAPPAVPKGPPKLPRRERRSALTDDDRQFLERVFGSIADRKAELLAEAKAAKRPPARRELLSSPEGKLQLLREEVKTREAQIARLSEIWGARERELLSVEDRLHDKDVEVQGLKMQIDDLLRRFNEAQEAFLQKEREHGATVDDLLLQRFGSEKDLIEVVAAKEKDLNALKRELNHRDDEITRRQVELETAHEQYNQLEKQTQLETLQGEVREKDLRFLLDKRETEIELLRADLDLAVTEALRVREERDGRVLALSRDLRDYENELALIQSALGTALHNLETRAETAERALPLVWEALAAERAERLAVEAEYAASLAEAEDALFETDQLAEDLRHQRDGIAQVSQTRIAERQAEIERLSQELADKIRHADERDVELSNELSQKLERIGELEGEAEALKQHLEEREKELNHQVTQLITDLEATQSDLEQTRADLASTQTAKREGEERAAAAQAAATQKISELTAQGEQTKAELEKERTERSQQESALRELIGNLEGDLEGLRAQKADLEQQLAESHGHASELEQLLAKERADVANLREQVGSLEGEKASLEKQLAELGAEKAALDTALAEANAHLAETRGELEAEQLAHGNLREEHQELDEAHKALQHQFGEREAKITQVRAELAATETALHTAEDKLAAQTEESARQIDLLTKDLQSHKQALADTKGKLTATAQEKQRRETELKLELDKRIEAGKSLETQVQLGKQQADQKLAELDKKRTELEAGLAQQREQTQKVTLKAQELQKRLEAASHQLEGLKKDSQSATAQRDQKLSELAAELAKEKAARKKLEDEGQQLRAQADARVKDALAKLEGARVEAAQKEQAAQQQLALRTKKVQEMEQALESAQSGKARAEREAAAKLAAGESKERELTAKLQQAMRALKESEAKAMAAVDDATAKAKTEIERRDQQRAGEIQRLQQSLQEKSKQLKVAELEVQRLKSRAEAPPPPPRPPVNSARPPTGGLPAARAAAPARAAPPQARPPSDFEATSMMNRNNLMSMLKDEQKGKAAPAKPSPMEAAVERTVVMRTPTAPAPQDPPEDDWTSVVDGLDK